MYLLSVTKVPAPTCLQKNNRSLQNHITCYMIVKILKDERSHKTLIGKSIYTMQYGNSRTPVQVYITKVSLRKRKV